MNTLKKSLYTLLVLTFFMVGCKIHKEPSGSFEKKNVPALPDYSKAENWAALPTKSDPADRVPMQEMKNVQADAEVDVFFIHPTTYNGQKGQREWNAPMENEIVNAKTDEGSILHQSSIFNGAGKVYAPRYRQAQYYAYFTERKGEAKQAFDLAYQDVKAAFEYYLKNHNKGRPIILAAHSQGTTHGIRLVKEFFDGTALRKQLVVAYLVGMPLKKNIFSTIKLCETADEVNCFCAWRTYLKGHYPKKYIYGDSIAVTNPLNWSTTEEYAPKELNEGALLWKFENGTFPELVDAQISKGMLWVSKPKFKGSFFIRTKNFHIADFNLFYTNIRKNATLRAQVFLEKFRQ